MLSGISGVGTILLVVRLIPLAADDEVRVSWSHDGTEFAQYTYSQPAAAEDVPVAFNATNAGPWPTGEYVATVTVNDVEVGVKTYTITDP